MRKEALSPLTQRLLAGGGAGALGGALLGGATADQGEGLSGTLRGGAVGLGAGVLGGAGYHLFRGAPAQAPLQVERALVQPAAQQAERALVQPAAQQAERAITLPSDLLQRVGPPTLPGNARTLPMDARTLPMDARTLPMDARTLPMDARTLPMDARTLPMDARTLPGTISGGPSVPKMPTPVPVRGADPMAPRVVGAAPGTAKNAAAQIVEMSSWKRYLEKNALSPLTSRLLTGAGAGAAAGGLGGAFLSDSEDAKMDALKGALIGAGVGALGGGGYHLLRGAPVADAIPGVIPAVTPENFPATIGLERPPVAPHLGTISGAPTLPGNARTLPMDARTLPMDARTLPMDARTLPMDARTLPRSEMPTPAFVRGADPMAPLVVGAAPGTAKNAAAQIVAMAKHATLAHYGLEKTALTLPFAAGGALGAGLVGAGAGAFGGGLLGAYDAEEGRRLEGGLRGAGIGGGLGGLVGAGVGALGGGYVGKKAKDFVEAGEQAAAEMAKAEAARQAARRAELEALLRQ